MTTLILFLPLVGSIIAGFFHTLLGERLAKIVTTFCIFVSAGFSWKIFLINDFSVVHKIELFQWISSGDLRIFWSIRLDALTAIMLVVICSISLLVHLYSFGYMKNDHNWNKSEHYEARFFSYLSLLLLESIFLMIFWRVLDQNSRVI